MGNSNDKRLFWACFMSLIATAFGFIVRTMILNEWQVQFGLSETQKGELLGAWLWPFAISIVLFSLIVDKIGYGRAMIVAFVCQAGSAIVTICAPSVLAPAGSTPEQVAAAQRTGYWVLYFGNFIGALGNGTVEAVINPVVATMFSREKTKWLNILHAGWPGGLVLGGTLAIALSAADLGNWQYKIALVFIPLALYAILMFGCKFPINGTSGAGISYRDMLKEAGVLSAMVVVALMVCQVGTVFELPLWAQIAIGVVLLIGYGAYVQSLGRAMFFFLVLIMIPLATTELGTDSWITSLMEGEMGKNAGWVIVYTSFIMMVLRFFAGPIVHKVSPLGLLALSAAIAAVGLVSLSAATGMMIFLAATLYGFGKTFFWPTMLGVVSEQFPKGGALTLNMIAGIGMLGVGIVGAAFLGNIQDKVTDKQLKEENSALYAQVIGEPKGSVFGEYRPLDPDKVKAVSKQDQEAIATIKGKSQKNALFTVAIFPVIMLVCYLILIVYFRARGGYKAEVLAGHSAEDKKFTGGTEGPGEA